MILKRNKIGKMSLFKFKTLYSYSNLDCSIDGGMNQWNRIEIPESEPHKYAQLIFQKSAKAVQQKRDSLFKKWC